MVLTKDQSWGSTEHTLGLQIIGLAYLNLSLKPEEVLRSRLADLPGRLKVPQRLVGSSTVFRFIDKEEPVLRVVYFLLIE